MPYQELMGYTAERKTWRVSYLRKPYSVSTRQLRKEFGPLSADDTEGGSRQAANQWWLAKRAELDQANQIFAIDTRRQLFPVEVPKHIQHLYTKEQLADTTYMEDETGALYRNRVLIGSEIGRAVIYDRLERAPAVKVEETIGVLIDKYLDNKNNQAAAGNRSPKTVLTLRSNFNNIGDFFGRDNSVKTLDGKKIEDFYNHLLASDLQAGSKQSLFSRFKTFVKWLYQSETIESLPRIMEAKLEFNTGAEHTREKIVYPIETIRQLLAAATPQEKLPLLLSLNMGLTASPIAEFQKSQIIDGRYNYRRHKTGRFKFVPLVKYVVWPETQELLEEVEIPNSAKTVSNHFNKLRKRVGLDVEHCHLRNSSASFLHNGPHATYADHWLGHSSKTIADKHYKKVFEQNFDAAVMWLREQVLG